MNKIHYILFATLVLTLSACSSSKSGSNLSSAFELTSPKASAQKYATSNIHFIDGIKEKSLENYEEAIQKFEACIKLNPYNDAAYFELSKLYLSKGDIALALENIGKANDLDIENYWYLISHIDILFALKKYEPALLLADKLIALKPDDVDIMYKKVNLLIKTHEFEKAAILLDTIEAKTGVNKEVSMQKEDLYRVLGMKEKALNEVIKLYFHDTTNVGNGLLLSEKYFKYDYPEKGEKILKSINTRYPNNGYAYLLYAELEKSKGNHEAYYNQLLHAFKIGSLNIDLKMKHLVGYFNLIGKEPYNSEVINLSKAMVDAHPRNAKAHAVYADFLYNLERLEEAIEVYKDALEINKSIFTVWHQTMLVAAELEDFEETIHIAKESLEYFPNQSMIYYIKSVAELRLHDYKNAIATILMGVNLSFDNKALKSEFYSNLGEAYFKQNEYQKAFNAFDNALAINPDNVIVLNNYSYYLSVQNEQLEKAKLMSKRSNELDPNNNSFEDTYAWILYKNGDLSEALIWIEKAIQHGGEKSATIIEHYGDILFKLNQKEKAFDQWIKAKNMGVESDFIDKKIEEKELYE